MTIDSLPTTEPPSRDSRRPIWMVAAAIACVLVAAILVYAAARAIRQPSSPGAGSARLGMPRPIAALQTRAFVLETLAAVGDLATTEVVVDALVDQSEDRTIGPLTLGKTRVLYVANGRVTAAVDLAAIGPDDVSVDDGLVTIKMPPPALVAASVEPSRSYLYDVDKSILGPPDAELQRRAESAARQRIVKSACDAGILETANRRAESAVRAVLGATGVRAVEVTSQAPGPCVAPPDPTPTPTAF